MAYRYFDYQKLKKLSSDVFVAKGYMREEADIISDVLVASDRMGIESHGVQRLTLYDYGLSIGRIKQGVQATVEHETPVSAVIDAHDGMAQLVAYRATKMAIEKAKKTGIGLVTIRNSNHYGIAGYYSMMAAEEGLMGISMTNAEALVVPTFGKQPMMGTNPIAVTMPAKPHMFHVDMATSVVPAGKIEVYAKTEKPLPDGWVIDKEGVVTNDANEFLNIRKTKSDGGLLPVGGEGELHSGHKGYGMSLLVELMCSIVSMGNTANKVRLKPDLEKCCHFVGAIDHAIFGDRKAIEDHFSMYLQEIRDSRKAKGQPRIYTHGDKAFEAMARAETQGIKVNDATYQEIVDICEKSGVDWKQYLVEK